MSEVYFNDYRPHCYHRSLMKLNIDIELEC